MYYSPLLCKSVPRSTSREFDVRSRSRDIQKTESTIHERLVGEYSNVIHTKRFGIEAKQGLGEHHEELAAMNRYDHPIHSPDLLGQMNLFATEACA